MTTSPVVSITDEQIDELEMLACKASPGPWWIDSHGHTMRSMDSYEVVFHHKDAGKAVRHEETGNLSHWRNDWDASFIATANPETILALIADARRYRYLRNIAAGVDFAGPAVAMVDADGSVRRRDSGSEHLLCGDELDRAVTAAFLEKAAQ